MNTKQLAISFITITFLLTGCAKSMLHSREKALGTKGQKNWVFHRLCDRDKGVTLAFPGYIIGIEKSKRNKTGAPSRKELRNDALIKSYDLNSSASWDSLSHKKKSILNDGKPMFVSHIAEYKTSTKLINRIESKFLYNAYDKNDLINTKEAWEGGLKALEGFKENFNQRIIKDSITHVFVMAMGWNSDQAECLRNFNSLYGKLMKNAENSGKVIRPLFIGLTWPSHWNERLHNAFSFFNKKNDADEIGMTLGNKVLNDIVLGNTLKQDFKTIVLGHSFGAKLTSQMTMSASTLNGKSNKLDLLINLQGAYSLNRYSAKKGAEESKNYEDWKKYVKYIALSTSSNDNAVKVGFMAPFAGRRRAYKKVLKDSTNNFYPDFYAVYYKDIKTSLFDENKKAIVINAEKIIKYPAHKKGGKAHSDIYNDEVSQMMWKLIEKATY